MSFTNMNSTIAENIKYFMYKYNFTYYDWFGPLHVILMKIECYVINSASTDDICAATATRELCNERDTCNMSDVHAHQGWGQVQYLYLVLVLKYIFIST